MCVNYYKLILFVISMQYSGECAHVLESDDSMVTACAFSGDSSLLATGIAESYGSKSLMSLFIASNYFCTLLSFKITLESSLSTLNLQFVSLAMGYTGLFISPSGISELDCATTKTDTAERSISIGRESLQVFFFLHWGLGVLPGSTARG